MRTCCSSRPRPARTTSRWWRPSSAASPRWWFNWAEGGRTPPIPLDRIAELGFAMVLYPIGTLLAATAGIRALLETIRADGSPAAAMPGLPSFDGFTDLVGLPEVRELEQRFGG